MRHVLLSNDDGVFASGLRALADAFLSAGWRVTVSAPNRERSATSHSITIKRPMVASPIRFSDVPQDAPLTVWAVDGTPADCVKLALLNLTREDRPDVVVSGINRGWNLGTDVHYSGTVGAAMEAAFEGTQAIAVSVRNNDPDQQAYAAQLAIAFALKLEDHPLALPSVVNLNVPNRAPDTVLGLREAPLTRIQYSDVYFEMAHDSGRSAYWLGGDIIEDGCTPGGDLALVVEGYATVSILGWDLTRHGGASCLLQDW